MPAGERAFVMLGRVYAEELSQGTGLDEKIV